METAMRPCPVLTGLARWRVAIALGWLGLGMQPATAQNGRAPAIVTVCVPCHGVGGAGSDVEVPNLAGQNSIYLRRQLESFRAGRRKHPDMGPTARELTSREIDQLVIYYSTLPP
jgi:cytochrome c553